jgi:hypothetical protein
MVSAFNIIPAKHTFSSTCVSPAQQKISFFLVKIIYIYIYIYIYITFFPCKIIILAYFFSFELRLRVCLAEDGYLTMISRIRNINSKPFSFSFAYRTYFSIADVRYRMFIFQILLGILIKY